jgi:hypothetical protein
MLITYWKRLGPKSGNSLALLESRIRLLKAKAGPVLFQLPPQFQKDTKRLAEAAAQNTPICFRVSSPELVHAGKPSMFCIAAALPFASRMIRHASAVEGDRISRLYPGAWPSGTIAIVIRLEHLRRGPGGFPACDEVMRQDMVRMLGSRQMHDPSYIRSCPSRLLPLTFPPRRIERLAPTSYFSP